MVPRELLAKIRLIEITARRLVDQRLAGQYHSVFKGRGMAFEDVRTYTPGDDVRVIDWNVSARMNEPYVKRFTEERDQTVMLIVDMSASLQFGSMEQSKQEVAAEIAALIAFSAIKNNDRVGLIIFTDEIELYLPPKKGKRHVLRVVREILGYKPGSSGTNINLGVDFLAKVAKRKTIAFLLSDFADDGWQPSLAVAGRRHDIVPVIISDPFDEELPPLGILFVEDLETGEILEFDSLGSEAAQYADIMQRRATERDSMLRRLRLDVVHVRTDRPYVDALVDFFQVRARRMHGA